MDTMGPMDEGERLRDEELAAFADALLEGEPEAGEGPRPPLADTVEMLSRTLHRPLPARLRRSVRQQVSVEWPQLHRPAGQWLRRWFGSLGQPRLRWAWAAVGALVVLAIAAVLLLPTDGQAATGTVAGGAGAVVPVVLLVLAAVLVVAWLVSRRR